MERDRDISLHEENLGYDRKGILPLDTVRLLSVDIDELIIGAIIYLSWAPCSYIVYLLKVDESLYAYVNEQESTYGQVLE